MKRRTFRFIYLFLAIVLLSAVYMLHAMILSFDHPLDPNGQDQFFEVLPGHSYRFVAAQLEKKDLIASSNVFLCMGWQQHTFNQIKAGEYMLSSRMSPRRIHEILTAGSVYRLMLTIPEGLTIDEMADLWESRGFGDRQKLIDAIRRFSVADFQTPITGWEGYLFPDTYSLLRRTRPEELTAMMFARFRTALKPEWLAAAERNGLSLHEVVTLASLIEKETRIDSERPIVASVFMNRLKRGMLLQCDPTVIYARRGTFDGNIRRSDLDAVDPYNTYTTPGLPPGPIANPGEKALYAACFPAETAYYYFVADGTGGHVFNKSLEEHHDAVKEYRKSLRD